MSPMMFIASTVGMTMLALLVILGVFLLMVRILDQ
jgi:hypothetical protein